MPVFSLPSPYGIGSFGQGAYDFIDFLHAAGQKCWQLLPLCPTSYGDSPYQSPAALAGNPYFIDLDLLCEQGLLKKAEIRGEKTRGGVIDYGRLFLTRYDVLRLAFSRFSEGKEYRAFLKSAREWIDDYSLFMALKVHNNHRAWYEWEHEHKEVRLARRLAKDFREECNFWKWVQYEFFRQWQGVLNYAHSKGILIIGDMPIYVAHDSMDVWRAPEQFLLDDDRMPTLVAGCPPDAYSETGQLWGNPIYNWELMELDGFSWWINRVRHSYKLYDILRIDHFRGFAGYYTIPAGDSDATRGFWNVAPGGALFDAIKSAFPKAKIISEDLGFITDDVRALLDYTKFPGMKVLQFAFYGEDSEYLPRTYTTDNSVVYTATQDSDCTRSWYRSLSREDKRRLRRECPRKDGQSVTSAVIDLALGSRANLAIVPIGDYLELTSEQGRINTPSTSEGNWQWRINKSYNKGELGKKILAHTTRAKRNTKKPLN